MIVSLVRRGEKMKPTDAGKRKKQSKYDNKWSPMFAWIPKGCCFCSSRASCLWFPQAFGEWFLWTCVSAVTSIWICHARSGNHWHVASTRYKRKMYMESTGGKVRNTLTFRRSQASQKAGILINFVCWTFTCLQEWSIEVLWFWRILLLKWIASYA